MSDTLKVPLVYVMSRMGLGNIGGFILQTTLAIFPLNCSQRATVYGSCLDASHLLRIPFTRRGGH